MKTPTVIQIDGVEGAGKSTLIENLIQYCKENNKTYQLIKLPFLEGEQHKDALTETLYNVMYDESKTVKPSIELTAMLMVGSNLIRYSEIDKSKDVILFDRTLYSSFIYQRDFYKCNTRLVKELCDIIDNMLTGCNIYTIFLRADVGMLRTRLSDRVKNNKVNKQNIDHLDTISTKFNELAHLLASLTVIEITTINTTELTPMKLVNDVIALTKLD